MSMFRSPKTKYVGVVLLVLLMGVLAGCYPEHQQSTFDPQGPVARSQLTLFYWIFWTAVVVFVLVEAALVYTVIRYRRKAGDGVPPQTHGHTPLEITWTVIPALILVVVAVPTIKTLFYNANSPHPPEEGGMTIDVTGVQWWWEFRYLNDINNPDDDVVTANELHIPVGKPVNIRLHSRDVIHSFWIPKIAGKVDLVPNNDNHMWIQADEPGEYLGQCAEFCGIAHALMRFRVFAQPQAEFDAWLAAQDAPAKDPIDPLALEGKALFEGAGQCFACHTIEGVARARGRTGPNLTHLGSRTTIAAGILENNQENLRKWIADPEALKPGNVMARTAQIYTDPTKHLTEAQISAIVQYLMTLD
ncbi:MAG: cytochrome c oxidase subunit II [SAR202 cluster bacterium]|nr:cytochrome c oxidase subunit II [SAR202 cluster bacterium]